MRHSTGGVLKRQLAGAGHWGGLAAATLFWYLLCFHGVFCTMLRSEVRPLRAYGIAWSLLLLFVVGTGLAIFWNNLIPATITRRSTFWEIYKSHALILLVDLAVAAMPLGFFRHRGPIA